MATDVQKIGQTILAQIGVVANQAAQAAQDAKTYAAQTADKAPLLSPAFTGTPTAPTPADLDNSTKVATTAYLDRLRGANSGLATLDNTGKVPSAQIPQISVVAVEVVASEAAMLALTAVPGTFAIRTDISNAVFILQQLPASTLGNWYEIGTSPVLSVAGLTGAIVGPDLLAAILAAPLASPGLTGTPTAPTVAGTADSTTKIATTAFVQAVRALLAPLASPALSGTPTAPSAAADTNTTQVATTAWVLGQLSQVADGLPVINGTAARGTSTRAARADHIHPTDSSRAPVASPTFTGAPTAPTPTASDNSTKLATTAYADAAVAALSGTVTTALGLKAPLASPTFTGTPAAPTATGGTNTTQVATTAFVQTAVGGISPGQPIPASSALPVGMAAMLLAGVTVNAGASTAGSNLAPFTIDANSGVITGGAAQTGTWLNITGANVGAGPGAPVAGLFVRTA